jgi:hypothetical protein
LVNVTAVSNFRDQAYPAVVLNRERWTETQIKKAIEARKWHVNMGCPGRNDELHQLQTGKVVNVEFTVADLILSDQILSPCEVCKIVKPIQRPRKTLRVKSEFVGHSQDIDYFYLRL